MLNEGVHERVAPVAGDGALCALGAKWSSGVGIVKRLSIRQDTAQASSSILAWQYVNVAV